MKNVMPNIDLSLVDLIPSEMEIAKHVIKSSKANPMSGPLRATKPKVDGEASYVWRMVAFQISPISQHHCMPVCADFDLPRQYWDRKINPNCHDDRRARIKELDKIADVIVNSVPKQQWHGIRRWGRALGQI